MAGQEVTVNPRVRGRLRSSVGDEKGSFGEEGGRSPVLYNFGRLRRIPYFIRTSMRPV